MFETTIAGSLPKPAWLAEPETLWPRWQSSGPALESAKASVARIREASRRLIPGPSPAALEPHRDAFFAALRNDFNEARRELKTLEPADRAAAQGWLEKADARDAALAASRQFAADAMTVLGKPAQ